MKEDFLARDITSIINRARAHLEALSKKGKVSEIQSVRGKCSESLIRRHGHLAGVGATLNYGNIHFVIVSDDEMDRSNDGKSDFEEWISIELRDTGGLSFHAGLYYIEDAAIIYVDF